MGFSAEQTPIEQSTLPDRSLRAATDRAISVLLSPLESDCTDPKLDPGHVRGDFESLHPS